MGNVLLKFDHSRLVTQVAALGGKSEDETKQILFHEPHDLENRFERGELTVDEFHRAFCDLMACDAQKEELMWALADIFWLNTPIASLLSKLVTLDFPRAILSNTCEAHWEFANREFRIVNDFFDQRVLSYEEKSMKPDSKIYQSAISLAKQLVDCEANEIFFTDDRQENVDAARAAGMQAELFVNTSMLARQLVEGGVQLSP